MNDVGLFLGGLVVLGIVSDRLLRRFNKSARKFPWCRDCGKNMVTVGLPKIMPGEVIRYLDQHRLPAVAASRFMCPKGHYQLWFVPKFGNTERAFFLKEEL